MISEKNLLTVNQRISLANGFTQAITAANVYLTIGQESPYTANDLLIPVPNQSTDYINNIWRNMVALKRVTAADVAFVVPRVDWQSGVVYDMWDNQVDMYSTIDLAALQGTVNVSNSRTVIGTNTTFLSQLTNGNLLYLGGDGENTAPQILQVTDILSNTSLNVNTSFSGSFIQNTPYLVTDTSPNYATNFYARNSMDQVFICLQNNNGVTSTVMPQLSIGGQLPINPFIITSDGYKWKYLYTIPSGQKQLFFSKDWMPVFRDPSVVAATVDGEIDIIVINNGGSGYNQNVASNSASIITIVGDGVNANATAKVDANGSIFDINLLNGGSGYTTANVVLNAGVNGAGANLRVIIGPQGGHGYNPVYELGATSVMVSLKLSGTEGGTLPTGASVGTGLFEYRQIGLILQPLLVSGSFATNTNYGTITTVTVQPLPAGQFFNIAETVYQGSSLAQATFVGTVVFWDDTNDILWLNNINGSFSPQSPIIGTIQTTPVTAFILTPSVVKKYSGRILYVNNVLPVIRGANQTEQVRLILSF
jgi:hypothetical protein